MTSMLMFAQSIKPIEIIIVCNKGKMADIVLWIYFLLLFQLCIVSGMWLSTVSHSLHASSAACVGGVGPWRGTFLSSSSKMSAQMSINFLSISVVHFTLGFFLLSPLLSILFAPASKIIWMSTSPWQPLSCRHSHHVRVTSMLTFCNV